MIIHYPTCDTWTSGETEACTCVKVWSIRKDPTELFPWQVFRLTGDGYEPLMSCSSFDGAKSLVLSMMKLGSNGLRSTGV